MKKKSIKLVLTVMVIAATLMMVGCKKDEIPAEPVAVQNEGKEEVKTEVVEAVEEKIFVVSFLDSDGVTELSKVEVKEGETVAEYTPTKDGYTFMGWFGTPSLSHNFDFTTAIKEDTKIFAGFLEHKEDTRSFAIVGSGTSPLLSTSSWGNVINEEHRLIKKAEENVHEITLDLLEGDEFQLAINESWNNQRGAGYFVTTTLDGVDYFFSSGGLSPDTKRSNMKVAKSGNYTLTLTTYPGADYYKTEDQYYTEENKEAFNLNPYDTITWTYNGEVASGVGAVKVTYFIKGAIITGWKDIYEEQYQFIEADGIHTLKIVLEEGDEFLFTTIIGDDVATGSVGNEYVRYTNITDAATLEILDGSSGYNMITKKAGTFTFAYNPTTKDLTATVE